MACLAEQHGITDEKGVSRKVREMLEVEAYVRVRKEPGDTSAPSTGVLFMYGF